MYRGLLTIGICLFALPFILAGSYLLVTRWPPMDVVTMMMPQVVRDGVSHLMLTAADFSANGLKTAKRAVKLSPTNEEAWTRYCATGVQDGQDMAAALQACARAEAMNAASAYPDFHAEIIAEAYEEARRPCDGLGILKTRIGPGKREEISPLFAVGRLEVTCGRLEDAEGHLRAVVRLREDDLRSTKAEDFPPPPNEEPKSYEEEFRVYLAQARENLSALLTLRHEDDEALRLCRAAKGFQWKQCSCQFEPRNGVSCKISIAL